VSPDASPESHERGGGAGVIGRLRQSEPEEVPSKQPLRENVRWPFVCNRSSADRWRTTGKRALDFPHQPGRYLRDFSGLVVEHDVFAGDERIGEINAEA